MLIEAFDLTAHIFEDNGKREVMFLVLIVNAEIDSDSESVISVIITVDHFKVSTATPSSGDVSGVSTFDHEVGWGERTGRGTELVITVDRAVIEVS